MTYYKVLTHSWCSPIRGGAPITDGHFPILLPPVALDTGPQECAPGWNFTSTTKAALEIGGMWPDGWPSHLVEVEPIGEIIERGNKRRASQIKLLRELDMWEAITSFSRCFSPYEKEMAEAQYQWWLALGRPQWDVAQVESDLKKTLDIRALPWTLKRYKDVRGAWDARDVRDVRDVRDARAAWDAKAVRDARAAWDARDAWYTWSAQTALIYQFAALKKWVEAAPDKYTLGIRDAYHNGLAIALPIDSNTLGWAMVEAK